MKRFLCGIAAILMAFSLNVFATVNINTASKSELEGLKGIGSTKAQAIIDYRTQHGSFKSVQDLKKVKGIGSKTLDKLAPELTVGDAAASPASGKNGKSTKGDKSSKSDKSAESGAKPGKGG